MAQAKEYRGDLAKQEQRLAYILLAPTFLILLAIAMYPHAFRVCLQFAQMRSLLHPQSSLAYRTISSCSASPSPRCPRN